MLNFTDEELKAKEARFIIGHPLFKEAFEAVRQAYVVEIENMNFTNEVLRDKLMFGLQNLKSVREALESHIVTADLKNQLPEDF